MLAVNDIHFKYSTKNMILGRHQQKIMLINMIKYHEMKAEVRNMNAV